MPASVRSEEHRGLATTALDLPDRVGGGVARPLGSACTEPLTAKHYGAFFGLKEPRPDRHLPAGRARFLHSRLARQSCLMGGGEDGV